MITPGCSLKAILMLEQLFTTISSASPTTAHAVRTISRVVAFLKDFPFASLSAAMGLLVLGIGRTFNLGTWLKRWNDKRYLTDNLNAGAYTPQDLANALRNYIQPDCQNIDPAGGEKWRRDVPVRQQAFKQLKQLLRSPEYRHTILLADSGMGKSSLMLNFYVRWRRARGRLKGVSLALIPLGHPRRDEFIKAVENKANTVLLLDAFDEDPMAAKTHKERLKDLLDISCEFRHVLLTCRTQFFRDDEEIPRETGIVRFGLTNLGQQHEYIFHKIYLSPFSDAQIERYVHKRWPIWRRQFRREAKKLCSELGDLTVRPMVLAYLEDLIEGRRKNSYKYTWQVYEQVVSKWCIRESAWVDPRALREFSEEAAVEVYSRREILQGERLPPVDADRIADRMGIPLEQWQIRGRSLLNRDSEGRLKFAHRSVMEYLYVCAFTKQPVEQTQWTAQMERFFVDAALHSGTDTRLNAGRAAIHLPLELRRTLFNALLKEPHALTRFPLSLEIITVEREVVAIELLLIAHFNGKEFLAVSKRRLPIEYVAGFFPSTRIYLKAPSLAPEGWYLASQAKERRDLLRAHHSAAFGVAAPYEELPLFHRRGSICLEMYLRPEHPH